MNPIFKIFSFFNTLVEDLLPCSMQTPLVLQSLQFLMIMILVCLPLFFTLFIRSRIKDQRKGENFMFICFVLVVIAITLLGAYERPDEVILIFSYAAFLLGLIYALRKWLNKVRSKDPGTFNTDTDLNLKHNGHPKRKLSQCPNCTMHTISMYHALFVPQTCGECGKRYLLEKPSLWIRLLAVPMFGSMILVIALGKLEYYSQNTQLGLLILVSLAFAFSSVKLAGKRKLKEVKK